MHKENFESRRETEQTDKVAARAREMKGSIPASHLPQTVDELREFIALRQLNDYSDPKDPSGLPENVREFMTKRDLNDNDYLVNAKIDWMEAFEPWFDMQETYNGWSNDELERLIKELGV